jgi:hypothetical protein
MVSFTFRPLYSRRKSPRYQLNRRLKGPRAGTNTTMRRKISTPWQTNSMVWVGERTIPTERPPLVGEVIAYFCGYRVPRGQRDRSLRPYSRFSRQEPLLFYQVAPQLYSRGWVDPVSSPWSESKSSRPARSPSPYRLSYRNVTSD